ncbi:SDR family NAD(P)-dependent oxidoreductase [Actinoplanes sp. N902-109]|uniref:SDR family NAD(P)-dependent oxidoreductase n=1 Tax=Actinoplanes sp. (strain N902-109) TaxID=649831 RepID=UPI0003295864|nr:SDR family oxidoreductase [Actinoplanes sp. N902-109]AGL16638.1 putative 3-oxoacyl-ACP reductase [Actinoplanes sp. N902-109]
MADDLSGRRVVVTGGTRGIGRESVLAFAASGARVLTCARRDDEHARSLAEELAGFGTDRHAVVTADVAQPDDVRQLAGYCRDRLGAVDVLVNNAGVDGHAPVGELSPAEWHRLLSTDLTACHLVTQALLPLLPDGASVVHLGASVAARGRPGSAHYTAAKAGLTGLTRSLAKELGGRGIRVNTVAPGVVVQDPDELGPHLTARLRAATALGRLARPAEIAAAVVFLAGDAAGYLTGTTLYVDGGM